MLGNNRLVITERDRELFREMALARILDREQIKEVAGFKTTSVVNARLLKLVDAGVLKRFFIGTRAGGTKALYALSKKGAELANVPARILNRPHNKLLVGDQWIDHQLAINSILIQLKFRLIPVPNVSLVRRLAFPSVLSKAHPLIPDAYFESTHHSTIYPMFCEVDRGTEPLKVWTKKAEMYLRFAASGDFNQLFHQPRFRVLIAANSARRLEGIRRTVAKLTTKVFWFTTLDAINRDGLFAPIWLRPEGTGKLPLL